MHIHPILIRHISNLTDARYFAAMQADWISISLTHDATSFSIWHSLRDWVEGLQFAAELAVDDESLLAKTIIEASPDGLIFPTFPTIEIPTDQQVFVTTIQPIPEGFRGLPIRILPYHAGQELTNTGGSELIFLEANWNTDMLRLLLNTGYTGGICFSGSHEDAVGIKDFSLLDDLIALLRD